MKCYKDEYGVDWAFDRNREWPGLLKCFIFGRNDITFSEKMLS